jgi:hypothetical protein
MRVHISLAFIGLAFAMSLGMIAATQLSASNPQQNGSELAYRGSGRLEI